MLIAIGFGSLQEFFRRYFFPAHVCIESRGKSRIDVVVVIVWSEEPEWAALPTIPRHGIDLRDHLNEALRARKREEGAHAFLNGW